MKTRSRIILRHIIMFVVFVAIGGTLGLLVTRYALKIPASRSVVPQELPYDKFREFAENDSCVFSLICPDGWKSHGSKYVITSSSQPEEMPVSGLPEGVLYVRGGAIKDVQEAEDEKKRRLPITFQGNPAYYDSSIKPSGKMFRGATYDYNLFFERHGEWYCIGYTTNRRLKEFPPPIIIEYFNTFRIEDENEAP